MSQLNYTQIQPLIDQVDVQNRSVRVSFRCPITGEQVQSSYTLRQQQGGISSTVERSLMYGVQSAISQTIRSVFGYSIFGRIAGDIARQGVYNAQRDSRNNLSESEKQQAIVAAFQSVSSRFYFDAQRNHWVSKNAQKELLSPFDLQLQQAPIAHNYDRQLLTRMLVEIAMADGHLAPAEENWLMSFLDPSSGSIQEIAQRPQLTSAELQMASKGPVRQSLLMLSWALALADQEFAASERQRLMVFAQGLGLNQSQVQAAEHAAQDYVLDQAMRTAFQFGHDNYARQHIYQLGSRIGMSQDKVSMAEAQFLRRNA